MHSVCTYSTRLFMRAEVQVQLVEGWNDLVLKPEGTPLKKANSTCDKKQSHFKLLSVSNQTICSIEDIAYLFWTI